MYDQRTTTDRSGSVSARKSRLVAGSYWLLALGSLLWLLLRSGANPRRLAYPCQRAALASSLAALGFVGASNGAAHLSRRLPHIPAWAGAGLLALALLAVTALTGGQFPATHLLSRPAALFGYGLAALPGWTSPSAVSDVFVVSDVPAPPCSLDGGALPAAPPCNAPAYALADAGVLKLLAEMASHGLYFYKTAAQPGGIVGAGDVVVIKINNQWLGDGDGVGRMSTNSDVLKGLIWQILQHPDGFSGEVVVMENTQEVNPNWDATPANAQDQNQSFQDVVQTFQGLGHPVSLYTLDNLHGNLISGGSIADAGYPTGEYARGDMADGYILLEDGAAAGSDELSYPKFRTAGGRYVSMRYGVWNGSSYASDPLTFINLPVLKKHGMAGATIAWKNLIGFVTIADTERRFGDWDTMHDFFWGYTNSAAQNYGLIGRELAQVRAPDLHLVDAIWVATEGNTGGNAVRRNVLLASTDPFAVDWYASEYVLRPLAAWDVQDSSAARAGVFRRATRTNQNAAAAVWPGGSYPYIDLLDSYDGDTPSDGEKNQMNVYTASAAGSQTAAPILPRDFAFTLPLFQADSAWNQKAAAAAVLPNSDQQILVTYRVLRGDTTSLYPSGPADWHPVLWVNHDEWTIPIFRAGSGQQSVTVCNYDGELGWPSPKFGEIQFGGPVNVPVPVGAVRPALPQGKISDGHLALFNPATGMTYDFWQATTQRTGQCLSQGAGYTGTAILETGAVDFFDIQGTGANSDTLSSARATGPPLLAGLILPEDIASGTIAHALALSIPGLRNLSSTPSEPLPSDYFYPATTTETGYYNTNPNALAAGQRIRLKQSIVDGTGKPVNESQLASITRIFLAALRVYGAYLVDNAGGFVFYAEESSTALLHLTDDQVNALIGQPAGTLLPADKTNWQIVLDKLNEELGSIPFAYGPWQDGQDPATAQITTANFEVVAPAARPAPATATPTPTATATPTPTVTPTATATAVHRTHLPAIQKDGVQ